MQPDDIADVVLGGPMRIEDPRSVLRAILDDVAAPFVPHPLGFARCPIGNSTRGTVYLHCWPGTDVLLQSDQYGVHRHSVTVTSRLLLGELADERYVWSTRADGDLRLYAQDLSRPGSGLVATDRIGAVTRSHSEHFTAGDRYAIPQGAFHSSVVDWETLVVTAAVFMTEDRQVPLVAGSRDGARRMTYAPPFFDSDALMVRMSAAVVQDA